MSKEIKLEAGQWYRTRGGSIVYCGSKSAKYKNAFLCECNSSPYVVRCNGLHIHGNCNWDLVEHLPDCTGFDWEPPKPEPKYRPFANAEEFKPFRDKWVVSVSTDAITGGFERVVSYDNFRVYVTIGETIGYWHWPQAMERFTFEDGTPFGVEVS